MPISLRASSITSGSHARLRPSASRQSAEPVRPELERLPCLATTAPAPAATNAVVDEMLNVMPWSPPVPTVSTVLGLRDEIFAAAWRMARAAAAISATVSPLAESAARNAPICASVRLPWKSSSKSANVSSSERSVRATSFERMSG